MNNEQKEVVRKAIDDHIAEDVAKEWQATVEMNTSTQEEYEWAYEHLWVSVDYQDQSINAELLDALKNVVTIFENGGTINEAAREADEAIRKVDEVEFTSDVVEQQAETITNMQTLITELREALRAIKARIEGEWDNEALDNMLLATTSRDCLHIATEALRKVVE